LGTNATKNLINIPKNKVLTKNQNSRVSRFF